jgi:hypothetical protein
MEKFQPKIILVIFGALWYILNYRVILEQIANEDKR